MLGPEADEFEFMRMHQSEYQNRPDLYFVLYKYKPINDFLWKTLETSEMWFSHYSKLNDEAEYMYEIESVNRASLKRLKRIIAPYVGFPPTLFPYEIDREPNLDGIFEYIGGRREPFSPMEHLFLWSLQLDASYAQHLKAVSTDDRWLEKTIEIAHEMLRWAKDTALVHCFSDDPQNEIMWTDYAGGGTPWGWGQSCDSLTILRCAAILVLLALLFPTTRVTQETPPFT